ncbi:C40 family peptidase [Streptomyces sp. AC550_RSS872]|uniref:C40 family peptidase n=1 Tax=Streptomyces sp. AC550_RSS872 TaxID=2823689 RepID=UPI0020B7BA06|nr:C40 family peptidase [Streptomyces sp. AC550_RSS872]
MAPERSARPGALSLPGMRNSALASAALTSVALLAQTANAAPSAGDESPSREEVSRRVSSLYDQAESDTGTFNATRAAATGPRQRADRPTDAGRRPATARNDDSGRGGPALDSVARQWFDVARSKLGPTVPAALPTDRMPTRSTGARAPRLPADGLTDRGREATGRGALELPAAPVAELTSGPTAATAAVAELTAGPAAAPPAAPEPPLETAGALQGTRPDQTALAVPAPSAEPSAELQQRASLRTSKERNQRKLSQARELLSLHTARPSASLTTVGALPAADTWGTTSTQAQPSADTQWDALRNQGPADLTTVPPGTTAWPPTPTPTADPPATTATSQALVTAQTYGTDPALDTSQAYATGQTYGTGQFYDTGQTYGANQAYDTGELLAAGTALTATAPQDTRAVRALDFARAQLGKPCVWGTSGPDAYDGPGLTQAAWKAAGISLPRTAPEQATAGQGIALTYLEPGDLVLFHVGHVGIYSGNGMMIHAPGPGAAIREESIHYAGESAIHSAIRPA